MSTSQGGNEQSLRPQQRHMQTQTPSNLGESIFDSEAVPSSLDEIVPILRVANEVERNHPRVAYLCRYYAFRKSYQLDPKSSKRGVRQLKTALFRHLERENYPTVMDAHELKNFCQHYYEYIEALQNAADKADRAQLTRAYQTANVLFEVLKGVYMTQSMEVDPEILEVQKSVAEKTQIYVPYNILPLDPDSANQAIMKDPQIQAAVVALRNMRGLPWPEDRENKKDEDILDWLQAMFGFQKDNVANQREHLILLLANVHIRRFPNSDQPIQLDDGALTEVWEKLFKNYQKWCEFLAEDSSLWLPTFQQEVQQHIRPTMTEEEVQQVQQYKLLYMGLYLLIWGEAANLRFMPECLCYIFHRMAFEVCGTLNDNVHPGTEEGVNIAYRGEEEAFLKNVVTPIYEVIKEESRRRKDGGLAHSQWRNYDDLNEYFWSRECFKQLDWPMRPEADFFAKDSEPARWVGKVNFVEIRSFWHIFRSFDRMWRFYILCLQVMIIVAWNCSGDPTAHFTPDVLKKVLSIFVSAAILKLGQVVLDVILNWKAQRSTSSKAKLRCMLKIVSAVAWVIILAVTYARIWENPHGSTQTIKSSFVNGSKSPTSFILAVSIYLSPNMLAALSSLFPLVRKKLENSDCVIAELMMWWSQPRLYVGSAMHESLLSFFKYILFWVLLIIAKLAFSYYIEIKPLVGPTKAIMSAHVTNLQRYEFFRPGNSNIGVVIAIWAPVILFYFMDTQIWYAIFSTFYGGIYGAFSRLGEIRTLGMLISRFDSLPQAFEEHLIPKEIPPNFEEGKARFAQLWNSIIDGFREEDLISDRERDLLLAPYWAESELNDIVQWPPFFRANWAESKLNDIIQWPPFLLAGKIPIALDMAKDSNDDDQELSYFKEDKYMSCAIRECYTQFGKIIWFMVQGEREKELIEFIFQEVEDSVITGHLTSKFKMSKLSKLYDPFAELIKCLLNNETKDRDKVVILFQDMLEIVTRDIMVEDLKRSQVDYPQHQLFASAGAITFPIEPATEPWKEMIRRLDALLTTKESAVDVPSNLEARRRLTFFSNSLFMEMPHAPKVRNMLSFSVLTPYYIEEVIFSLHQLEEENEDGVSILFYLRKIYPDEWTNFLERVNGKSEEELRKSDESKERLRCLWASYRGQTLTRTVRGMMYYRKALELQAFLEMAEHKDLMGSYKAVELNTEEHPIRDGSLWDRCQAVADVKFTYVVSCQQYGIDKRAGHQRAKDILRLMTTYPSIRVAYIDEVEESSNDQKAYYSTLVKAALPKSIDSLEPVQYLDQVIYRIKLPGPAILGEGKPENQNHAIIFTRGEGLQTIDMNQDNYMEEALKMRNLLQEFLNEHDGVLKKMKNLLRKFLNEHAGVMRNLLQKLNFFFNEHAGVMRNLLQKMKILLPKFPIERDGVRNPTILGLREHIFTGSVSSLAWFMSNQETSFVTIGQRLLANPLKVRFHYGHPDVFDRLFHISRGGISKASQVINLSEDIFAGFNSTLREGKVTHHEYIQVGKGRDVGLNQISMFEAKIANGNGEQTLSRDVYRVGHRFDFFRMLSCYFTTVGFYISTLITVLTVYVFLYGRLYLVLSGLEKELSTQPGIKDNKPLQVALASQSFVQMGFLLVLPMLMEICLERGFRTAFNDFLLMQLQLAPVFFTFSLGTKTHYYGRTLLHGGAGYRATGRGFVVFHAKFADNYRMYSRSHFVKGFELMILLLVYQIFGQSYRGVVANNLITIYIWFMVGSWLFAPFLFNPSGFEWQKIVDDWTDWNKWISKRGGIGVHPERSWEAWWEKEQQYLRHSGKWGITAEIILALRFFIYQYGLVYHLKFMKHINSVQVYGISWLVIFLILCVMKAVSVVSQQDFRTRCLRVLGAKSLHVFRLIRGIIILSFVILLIALIALSYVTMWDIMVCIFALMPTGWGMLSIAQACKPFVVKLGLWGSFKTLARGYEIIMGFSLFTPVAFLAWFPFVSEFQTRMLFNQAFSRGLQISRILGGQRKDKDWSSNKNE